MAVAVRRGVGVAEGVKVEIIEGVGEYAVEGVAIFPSQEERRKEHTSRIQVKITILLFVHMREFLWYKR